jgi:hypothetical protein
VGYVGVKVERREDPIKRVTFSNWSHFLAARPAVQAAYPTAVFTSGPVYEIERESGCYEVLIPASDLRLFAEALIELANQIDAA